MVEVERQRSEVAAAPLRLVTDVNGLGACEVVTGIGGGGDSPVLPVSVFAQYGSEWYPKMRGLLGELEYNQVFARPGPITFVDFNAFASRPDRIAILLPSGRVVVRRPNPAQHGEALTLYASLAQYKAEGYPGVVYDGDFRDDAA